MTGRWTRWRISSAIERGKPLSRRLRREIQQDPQSRQFYEASLAVAARLRRDATQIIRHEENRLDWAARPLAAAPSRAPAPRRVLQRRRPFALAAVGLVLVSVVGLGLWWWLPASPLQDPQRPMAAQQQDVRELVEIVRRIDQTVDRVAAREGPHLRERLARSGDALRRPILREARNIVKDTREILDRFSSIIPPRDRLRQPEPEASAPSPRSSGRNGRPAPADVAIACSGVCTEIAL